jgi:hypothetical protein
VHAVAIARTFAGRIEPGNRSIRDAKNHTVKGCVCAEMLFYGE